MPQYTVQWEITSFGYGDSEFEEGYSYRPQQSMSIVADNKDHARRLAHEEALKHVKPFPKNLKPYDIYEYPTILEVIGPTDRENEEPQAANKHNQDTSEEEFIGIGIFGDRIRLISLEKDGRYKFIDETQNTHHILYVVTSETLAMREAVEELESLMNDPRARELDFQDFFERNPKFILNDEYKRAHPHITLMRDDEGPLIPDFLLEPLDQNALCDILDLKLPGTRIYVLKQSRMRYSAAVLEACAQLREYSGYFDEERNRDLVYQEYGLLAYRPRMIVIIGRRGDVDPIIARRIESDLPNLILRTYDDVLNRAKARLKIMR